MISRFSFLEIITPDSSLQATVHHSGFMADSKYIVDEAKTSFTDGVHKATERAFNGARKILYSPMKSSYSDCCYLSASGVHTHSKARGMGYEQIYIYQKKDLQKKDRFLDEIFGTILVNESDAIAVYYKELNGADVCSAYRMVPRINRFDAEDPDYYNVAKAILALADKKRLIVRLRDIKSSIGGEALELAAREFLLKLYSIIPVGLRTEYGFCAFGSGAIVDKDNNFDILVFPSDNDVKIELLPMANTVVIDLDREDIIPVPEYLAKWFRLDNDRRLAESKNIISRSIKGALDEIAEAMSDQREWWQKEESTGTIESIYELVEKHSKTPSLAAEGKNTELLRQIDRYFKTRPDEGGFERYVWELLCAEDSDEKKDCIKYCRRMFEKSTDPSVNRRFAVLESFYNEHAAKTAKERELERARKENKEMNDAINELIKVVNDTKGTLDRIQRDNETAEKKNSEELRKLNEDINRLRDEVSNTTKELQYGGSGSAYNDDRYHNNETTDPDQNGSSKAGSKAKEEQLPPILGLLKKNLGAVVTVCALVIMAAIMALCFSKLNSRLDILNEQLKNESTIAPTEIVTAAPSLSAESSYVAIDSDKPSSTPTNPTQPPQKPTAEPTDTPQPVITNTPDTPTSIWDQFSEKFDFSESYSQVALDPTDSFEDYFITAVNASDVRNALDMLRNAENGDAIILYDKFEKKESPSQIVIINKAAFDVQKQQYVDTIINSSQRNKRIGNIWICYYAGETNDKLNSAFEEAINAL